MSTKIFLCKKVDSIQTGINIAREATIKNHKLRLMVIEDCRDGNIFVDNDGLVRNFEIVHAIVAKGTILRR